MGLELIGTHVVVFVLGVVTGHVVEGWSRAWTARQRGPRR